MTATSTQALLEIIRWSAPPAPVNWRAVQKAVGVTYPAEFREVADALPPGSFQTFLSLLHPTSHKPRVYAEELLGYAGMLSSSADSSFPYPIYPAAGGLLPWAVVGFDYIICWLTEGDDPDAWPVVICSAHLSEWQVHRMSTAEFLRAVLTVPSPIELLDYVAEAQQPPSYIGVDGAQSDQAGPDERYWVREAEGRTLIGPADAVEQLRELVTPAPPAVPDWYDVWMKVQGKIGWPPPADYQHLVEELGAITVGGVTVAVPGGPVDLVGTYEKLRRRVNRELAAAGGPPGPVWPAKFGVLRWADIAGGGHVCWLAVSPDPDTWPVIVLDAELRRHVLHMMTASRFLLELATNPDAIVLEPPG
ncbi:hypothetical protein [Paractinoplanes durhamensis]|uniref:Knr4/Smi1-like domain-containing protein n=1 Tax=Paractinoplanes durhamensis TaxID=113563 RepID=A0ABQ3YP51_9ACTN|nr:hypothetical protein [Actinoplanes durhamensis]GID99354.1 hypothetical protein Adu01nite_07050 [Actinoplanes durhamensis]